VLRNIFCQSGPLVTLTLLMALLIPAWSATQSDSHDAVINIGGAKIEVVLPEETMHASSTELLNWVRSAARAVSGYYGRFPAPHLTLRIRAGNGSGIRHGVTYPKDGGLILITVGRETETDELNDDWTLTHEMIHLAFPNMPDNHHWIEEGIATYVEPVARAQAGNLPVSEVWKEFIREMPKGEPQSGDRGLDHTATWGRTYWGGALFCLLADVQIREQTHNHKGLQDALRAIVDHGGGITEDWEIERALTIGDKATDTAVLQTLYREMRDRPHPVDLKALWKKLGVELRDGKVIFNDNAPDAAIRVAISN
jgi:hypothetical protein